MKVYTFSRRTWYDLHTVTCQCTRKQITGVLVIDKNPYMHFLNFILTDVYNVVFHHRFAEMPLTG